MNFSVGFRIVARKGGNMTEKCTNIWHSNLMNFCGLFKKSFQKYGKSDQNLLFLHVICTDVTIMNIFI